MSGDIVGVGKDDKNATTTWTVDSTRTRFDVREDLLSSRPEEGYGHVAMSARSDFNMRAVEGSSDTGDMVELNGEV